MEKHIDAAAVAISILLGVFLLRHAGGRRRHAVQLVEYGSGAYFLSKGLLTARLLDIEP